MNPDTSTLEALTSRSSGILEHDITNSDIMNMSSTFLIILLFLSFHSLNGKVVLETEGVRLLDLYQA